MDLYTVHLTDEAWTAIEEQLRYIAVEQQAPVNASRWVVRLMAAVATLERLPDRYCLDEHQTRATGTNVHRLVFERTYLLFYPVDRNDRRVTVLCFRHGAREERGGTGGRAAAWQNFREPTTIRTDYRATDGGSNGSTPSCGFSGPRCRQRADGRHHQPS